MYMTKQREIIVKGCILYYDTNMWHSIKGKNYRDC
jgi:hypothetical protein